MPAPLVSDRTLRQLRAVSERAMPDTAQIQRATTASDGMGGRTTTWATIATVACGYAPSGQAPQEVSVGGAVRGVIVWRFRFPVGTDVRSADRIIVGSRTFEVVGALGPRTYEASHQVAAVEVG